MNRTVISSALIVVSISLLVGCLQVSNNAQTRTRPRVEPNYVKLTDVPGFGLNGTSVTIHISSVGLVRIETRRYGDTQPDPLSTSVKEGKITTAKADTLFQLIKSTNFFELKDEDSKPCTSDVPTVSLEIKVGGMVKTVHGIGAECTPARLVDAKKIVAAVRQAVADIP